LVRDASSKNLDGMRLIALINYVAVNTASEVIPNIIAIIVSNKYIF
jgi:hypothetical protein